MPSLARGEIAAWAAATLRRTGLVAIHAKRIVSFGDGLQTFFEPDFVPPRNVQIIFVGETGSLAKAQAFQRRLWRSSGNLPGTVPNRTQAELKKVDAFPAHRDLDHAMQLAKRNGRRHVHPAPYHRLNPNSQPLNCMIVPDISGGDAGDGPARLGKGNSYATLCSMLPRLPAEIEP